MAASPTAAAPLPPRPRRRRYVVLLAAIAIVIAGWSALWWQAASMAGAAVDDTLADIAAQGVVAGCPGKRIAGYPFLLELRCDATSLAVPDAPPLAAGALVVVARLYAPNRVITELTGPLTVGPSAAPLATARWSLGQASLRVNDMFGTPQLGLGAVAVENLELFAGAAPAAAAGGAPASATGTAALAARSLELHLRPTPQRAGALDIALTAGAATVPGLPTADLRLLMTIPDGMALAAASVLPAQGLVVEVTEASLEAADADVRIGGALTLRPDGLVDGKLAVTTADPAKVAALLGTLLPPGSALPQAVAGAITAFGKPGEVDGVKVVTVPLGISESRVSIGIIPLGRIPRLDVEAVSG